MLMNSNARGKKNEINFSIISCAVQHKGNSNKTLVWGFLSLMKHIWWWFKRRSRASKKRFWGREWKFQRVHSKCILKYFFRKCHSTLPPKVSILECWWRKIISAHLSLIMICMIILKVFHNCRTRGFEQSEMGKILPVSTCTWWKEFHKWALKIMKLI